MKSYVKKYQEKHPQSGSPTMTKYRGRHKVCEWSYCEQVESNIADVKNIGAPMQAGTIAGAAFLKEFVGEKIPWVHFDIAGTAWGGKELPYTQKNSATGAVIRLVLNLLGM